MSVALGKHISRKKTSQRERIPGRKDQVKNNAGGYVFEVDKWSRLQRFLILGSDGGTYYVSEKNLTVDNAQVVEACLAENFKRTVDLIVEISDSGRAPKNDPAILALAIAASTDEAEARKYALAHLSKVCRIPTHLFHFVEFVRELRGFGRGLRSALAGWYEEKTPESLAFNAVKYQSRDGWSHRDVIRLSHPDLTAEQQAVVRWVLELEQGERQVKRGKGEAKIVTYPAVGEMPVLIGAFEEAKTADTKRLIQLIEEHRLTWEMLPTEALNKPEVWAALLQKMPLGAMIRNLGKMTAVGTLAALTDEVKLVTAALTNVELLKKARIHPLNVLVAMRTYAQGRGVKGKLTWTPVQAVVDALDAAFYKAFGAVTPTGKNLMLALDVSGSMGSPIANLPISCREAAAAMALVTANVEPNYVITGFTSGTRRSMHTSYFAGRYGAGISELKISPRQRLDDVVNYIAQQDFGGTDCALPMIHATEKKMNVDAFCIYTDNETWAGDVQPVQALADYRKKQQKPEAACVVVGMTATRFSIADPKDQRMLDVVGFDTVTPNVIGDFVRG